MNQKTDDKRLQPRFPVDTPILVAAVETDAGHIRHSLIKGRTLNVSASGALIELEESINTNRIWIRLADNDPALSECYVVREAGPRQYGVHFAYLWSAQTIRSLLQCAIHVPTDAPQAAVSTG